MKQKNYSEEQRDLILLENHYCLITKSQTLINKDSLKEHECRRCLTAFSSEDTLKHHKERCQKQQPTKISFSWKDHLTLEENHNEVDVPIRAYFDFEGIK